jgi:2-polyprenyl-3-methyl-5-hydroxy-6-metoxy-1,4-benzoquinol methylase
MRANAGLAREVADLYAPFGWWRRFYAGFRVALARLDEIEPYLPRSGRVLDLGCGYGVVAHYLALSDPGRAVLGIDLDERRIGVALKTVAGRSNPSFVRGDVMEASFPDFNAVLMNDFLHHLQLDDQERLLERLHLITPEGGMLLLQEVNTRPRWKYYLSLLADLILYCFEGGHFRSPEEWTRLLAAKGFRGVQVFPGDKGSMFARVSYIAYK